MKTLKIDRFYIVLVSMLVVLAVITFFTLRTVFGSINKSHEVDTTIPQDNNLSINANSLNEALKYVSQKNFTPLDLK
ncbi:hypothetical protein HYS03_01525 [Candidatus Woesebacteria bacterium]|nr:hypothetical protein [Candidatus Woesebacteria bacterium]QQG47947.1 MAG: hypothetical protein HY044_02570 [Candidatus Woesebacteria bacterium]